MKSASILVFIFFTGSVLGQNKTLEDLGYRHIVYQYKTDKVDILIKSKKGEENIKKPLFFFCQGSLPIPLVISDEKGIYGVYPFNPDSLSVIFHLVIVGKPSVPLIANVKTLTSDFLYKDSLGKIPKAYNDRNLPEYYVSRNIAILKFLRKENWVSQEQLIVAGHSEGSTIAATMATEYQKISHLIYSGGNPLGRIMSIVQEGRSSESDTSSSKEGENAINYWQQVVKNRSSIDANHGDSPKTTFEFSNPPIAALEGLKIPVLVSYGTKDWGAPFIDYLRVDMIRKEKTNFTFLPYIGTDHNFFPVSIDNKPNYSIFNWDRVANDWRKWLEQSLSLKSIEYLKRNSN